MIIKILQSLLLSKPKKLYPITKSIILTNAITMSAVSTGGRISFSK